MNSRGVTRTLPIVTILVLIAVNSVGCTHHYEGQVIMQPGDQARFRMYGSRTELMIRNLGPGIVALTYFDDQGNAYEEQTLRPTSTINRVRRSRLEIVAENESDSTLTLEVEGRAPEGLAVFVNGEQLDEAKFGDRIEVFRNED